MGRGGLQGLEEVHAVCLKAKLLCDCDPLLNAFNRLTDGYYEWLQSRDMALPYEVGARFWQNFVRYDPQAEEQQEEGIKEDL